MHVSIHTTHAHTCTPPTHKSQHIFVHVKMLSIHLNTCVEGCEHMFSLIMMPQTINFTLLHIAHNMSELVISLM